MGQYMYVRTSLPGKLSGITGFREYSARWAKPLFHYQAWGQIHEYLYLATILSICILNSEQMYLYLNTLCKILLIQILQILPLYDDLCDLLINAI